MRASLGTPGEVGGLHRRGAERPARRHHQDTDRIPRGNGGSSPGLRDALVTGHAEPLPFHRDLPVPPREAYLDRTDPNVAAIARYVLESALDPDVSMDVRAPHGGAA